MRAQGRSVLAERVDLDRVVLLRRADVGDQAERPAGRGHLRKARGFAVAELEGAPGDHGAGRSQRRGAVRPQDQTDGLRAGHVDVDDHVADPRPPALLREPDGASLGGGAHREGLGAEGALRRIGRRDGRVRAIEPVRIVDAGHGRPRGRPHHERFADAAARGALPVGLGRVAMATREALESAGDEPSREWPSRGARRARERRRDGRSVLGAVGEGGVALGVAQRGHDARVESVEGGLERRDLPGVVAGLRRVAHDPEVGAHRQVRIARRVDVERLRELVRQSSACRAGSPRRRPPACDDGHRAEHHEGQGARSRGAHGVARAIGAAGTRRTLRCINASTRCTQARHFG